MVAEPDRDDFEADPATLRRAARLARARAQMPRSVDHRDGLERLGGDKALTQLAKDLEATADDIEAQRGRGGD